MPQLAGTLQYSSIRKYLEQIYLYGFFSREDWAAIGVVKDYDKMLMLLRELYPELYNDAIREGRRKYLRFQRKYAGSIENRLVNTYLLHALGDKEMGMLLHILSFVGIAPRTIQDIVSHMQFLYDGSEGASHICPKG